MKRFLANLIRNNVLVNVLMVGTLIAGAIAWMTMVREMFPEIHVNTLQIQVSYPGADPEEVEEGISRKIEEAIDGVEGIKKYRTVSAEGMSTTVIEIEEDYPFDVAYRDIRNAVDAVSTLPASAEKPVYTEATINEQIVAVAVWGDHPERVLKELAEDLKDEIQALPSISQVTISGTRDYEIAIEVSEEALRKYGLSFSEVARKVQQGNLNLAGGTIRAEGEEIRLRTIGRKYSADDFADIVVVAESEGDIITLDEIATIRDAFIEDRVIAEFNGEPTVMLTIFKTTREDAMAIARELRGFIRQKQQELPPGLNLTVWSDRTIFIDGRIDLLIRNGLYGLVLVFFSLWLFLELRLSFWVMMGIPISLAGGLVLMWLVGASINTISLFGLIMVLGIVVDDAIIVGEAIFVHRRAGDGPMQAAVNGVMEVGLPVLAAVTTSIVAFMPLLFVAGVMGKFVSIIPVAVIAALVMSLVESLFILPSHLNHLPDLRDKPEEHKSIAKRARLRLTWGVDWIIEHVYSPIVHKAVAFRYIGVCVAVAVMLVTMGLWSGGFVKFVLFPEIDGNDIIGSVEFPNGTPLNVTERAVGQTREAFNRVAEDVAKEEGKPIVRNVYAVTGIGAGGSSFERTPGNNLGHVQIELVDSSEREITSQELMVRWEEEVGPLPGVLAQTFNTLEQGPPGAPVHIALKGEEMDVLLAVSERLKEKLRTYDGVYQVKDSYRPGKTEVRIFLKPEARTLGITLDDLARQVYAGFYGEEALRLQRGRDDIRVKVRYTEDERSRMAELDRVRVRTADGHEVPFFTVADVEFGKGFSSIFRQDGQLTVDVTAEVDQQRANPDEILTDMRMGILQDLLYEHPGFTYSFEGAQTESREAFEGLMIGFPIAIVMIYLIIASVFRSYIQPVVIMVTVPFGFIGGIWGHWAFGIDVQMFSVFGMVALTGIVVNDSIVLIEAVNHQLARGADVLEAIARGGARRFRAIILTSVTTVGGLTPIILEQDVQAQIVIPMAISIAAGVLFATLLTLLFIPCLLAVLNDLRRVLHWILHTEWPTREQVEPARTRYHDPFEHATGDEPAMAK